MEITKSNFTEKLEEIEEAIHHCDFLSLDAEFTGLDTVQYGQACPFDTPAERYTKLRKGSLDFLIIQFGLCAFKFIETSQSYEARPYNFYIFPRPYSRSAPDRRFLCQSSSIDFLVQQGFDFNKLFREGISYLTSTQENDLREALNCKHQQFSKFSSPAFVSPDSADMGPGKGPIQIPDDQKDFIAGICDKISSFLESAGDADIVQLDPCNGFQRKLIYQTVRSRFNSVHLETKTGEKRERFIVVTRVASEEELQQKEKEKQNLEIMELKEAVGFSKVLKLVSQSGKLVVGHNMLLDIMLTLNQFFYPLPEEYDEFKDVVKCCLPRILDTKLMASTHPFREVIQSTVLDELRKSLNKEPFTAAKVELADGFRCYESATDMYHEAGYDAFITGCIFTTMANYLGKTQSPELSVVLPASKLLQPFVNKMFLMRMADVPYINLNGSDLHPNRDHVFHLTFPKEWKPSDINHLFAPYGSVQISWLNDISAYISLYKKDNASLVLKALGQEKSQYQLIPYNVFKAREVASLVRKRIAGDADIDCPVNKKHKSLDNKDDKPEELSNIMFPDNKVKKTTPDSSFSKTEHVLEAAKKALSSSEKLFPEPSNW